MVKHKFGTKHFCCIWARNKEVIETYISYLRSDLKEIKYPNCFSNMNQVCENDL